MLEHANSLESAATGGSCHHSCVLSGSATIDRRQGDLVAAARGIRREIIASGLQNQLSVVPMA